MIHWTDAHFRWADLYLRALDLVITHDLRPMSGPLTNLTTMDARREAAVTILKEAFNPEITRS